jgi:hypothetical protein
MLHRLRNSVSERACGRKETTRLTNSGIESVAIRHVCPYAPILRVNLGIVIIADCRHHIADFQLFLQLHCTAVGNSLHLYAPIVLETDMPS